MYVLYLSIYIDCFTRLVSVVLKIRIEVIPTPEMLRYSRPWHKVSWVVCDGICIVCVNTTMHQCN